MIDSGLFEDQKDSILWLKKCKQKFWLAYIDPYLKLHLHLYRFLATTSKNDTNRNFTLNWASSENLSCSMHIFIEI